MADDLTPSPFSKLVSFLSGKKTYIVAAIGVLYALGVKYWHWPNDPEIWGGLGFAGLATLRAAVTKLCALLSGDILANDRPAEAARRLTRRAAFLPCLVPIAVICILSSGCVNGPVYPNSPLAVVGSDFTADAASALQAYADYKAGNVNMTWSLPQLFNAYALSAKTATDVKAFMVQWLGTGDDSKKLMDRIARVFNASTAPPAAKMAALATVAQTVAQNKGA